jgi:hypothetical protein
MTADGESHQPAAATEESEPVRDKTWADRAQIIVAGAAVVALFVTIIVAWQGQRSDQRGGPAHKSWTQFLAPRGSGPHEPRTFPQVVGDGCRRPPE